MTRGTFAFVAGEIAKAGRLGIDTPVATMRGRTQTGGFGMLSMAALYFAIMDDAQAGSSNAALFDDGIIDYKDLAHGVFDVVTKEAIPRHFVVDDPGKTVVLHRLGSSISADFVTNSVDANGATASRPKGGAANIFVGTAARTNDNRARWIEHSSSAISDDTDQLHAAPLCAISAERLE